MKKHKRKLAFADTFEQNIANALSDASISYVHESEGANQRLDFYLPDFDIFLEVKQFHTERINGQMKSQENVILIQGKKAIEAFCAIIKNK